MSFFSSSPLCSEGKIGSGEPSWTNFKFKKIIQNNLAIQLVRGVFNYLIGLDKVNWTVTIFVTKLVRLKDLFTGVHKSA